MALTFPISIPDYSHLQTMRIRNINATASTVSPYTFARQTQEHAGDAFVFYYKLIPQLTKVQAGQWIAFLKALRGGANTFLLGDAFRRSPQGTASYAPGTPLVAGASQTGGELDVDGLPANATGYLLRGDWIQLGSGSDSHIYMVVEDVDADGSGQATIAISPELRSSPADNAAVTVSNTECVVRLVEPNVEWSIDAGHLHDIEFEAVEDL